MSKVSLAFFKSLIVVGAVWSGLACGQDATGPDATLSPAPTVASDSTTADAAQAGVPPTITSADLGHYPSPGEAQVAGPTGAPTPEPRPGLADGEVGVYLAVHGGSSSDLLRALVSDSVTREVAGIKNIVVEKDSKAVVMYLPEADAMVALDSYTSPSYAPHTKRPYTVDDRLFIGTKYSSSLTYAEYDPETLQAVINDQAKEEVATSQSRYRTKGARSEDPVSSVSRLNQATQEVEVLVSFDVEDLDAYVQASWYHIAVDNDTAYWAGLLYSGEDLWLEIARYPLEDPLGEIKIDRFSLPRPAGKMVNILKIDADDGHIVIQPRITGGGDSSLILLDMNTGFAELGDTGLEIFDLQILRLGEPG